MAFPMYYVICVICISKKLEYLKNEFISNKTNLILGFSSPLKDIHTGGVKSTSDDVNGPVLLYLCPENS